MTSRPITTCALAGLLVGGIWTMLPARVPVVRADGPSVDQDTDGDFLPDVVEWACLTNAASPDTDADGSSDFIEVVQRGNPRRAGDPLPQDHEMRVVVTSGPGPTGREVYLHLLFRFMGSVSLLSSLDVWGKIGPDAIQVPLAAVAMQPISVFQRLEPGEGLWVRVTVPLVSEEILRYVLPCSIGADAVIGARAIHTSVPLIDRSGTVAAIVPYSDSLFAVQSIESLPALEGAVSNRVCVLELERISEAGPNAFIVRGADCLDCNDLVCGVDCESSTGTILILPGGAGPITGG